MAPAHPGRNGIGRRPHDHPDARGMHRIDDAVHPGMFKSAFFRFPKAPCRLTHSDHGQARPRHQLDVLFEPFVGHVLVVVGSPVKDSLGCHLALAGSVSGHESYLTAPSVRPPCQKRCSIKKTATTGTTLTSAPVSTSENMAWPPPPPWLASWYQEARPTVSGKYSG